MLDRFDQAALRPKKYANAGLRPDVRIASNSLGSSAENGAEPVIGGLTDEQAHATRPADYATQCGPITQPVYPAKLQRNLNRKNEVSPRLLYLIPETFSHAGCP